MQMRVFIGVANIVIMPCHAMLYKFGKRHHDFWGIFIFISVFNLAYILGEFSITKNDSTRIDYYALAQWFLMHLQIF